MTISKNNEDEKDFGLIKIQLSKTFKKESEQGYPLPSLMSDRVPLEILRLTVQDEEATLLEQNDVAALVKEKMEDAAEKASGIAKSFKKAAALFFGAVARVAKTQSDSINTLYVKCPTDRAEEIKTSIQKSAASRIIKNMEVLKP